MPMWQANLLETRFNAGFGPEAFDLATQTA
jgi:hypothetical protein